MLWVGVYVWESCNVYVCVCGGGGWVGGGGATCCVYTGLKNYVR